MRKTAIVTDSVATVPAELAQRYDIGIVPLEVIFGLESFHDGIDMTPAEFYRRLATDRVMPKTSAPSVGELAAAYAEAARRAEAVVAIHLAASLSATVTVAHQAAALIDTPVHVLDCRTAAAAQGLIVLAAARAAEAGAGAGEVLATTRKVMDRVYLLVMLDTLHYLRKGGRIGGAQAWLGMALRFKPIVALANGRVVPVERPRTRPRGVARLVELMAEATKGRPVHVAVTHAEALTEAEALRDRIAAQFDCRELIITELTPVMGAHAGPGVLGIAFWAED
ncbi:MAG: DegV family protein [Anaerolineae bacterium]|nr:DegV family protein [Anaerolineae bacterium]